jgi:hypothetical protein
MYHDGMPNKSLQATRDGHSSSASRFAKLFLASPPTIRRRVAFIILVVLSDSVWSGMLYTLMADILTRHILHSALT